jgi:cold shock protein
MTEGSTAGRVSIGRVSVWYEGEGWGVVESPDFASPVWAHYAHIDPSCRRVRQASGYRVLKSGEDVRFTAEAAEQDGYHWRATWVIPVED